MEVRYTDPIRTHLILDDVPEEEDGFNIVSVTVWCWHNQAKIGVTFRFRDDGGGDPSICELHTMARRAWDKMSSMIASGAWDGVSPIRIDI